MARTRILLVEDEPISARQLRLILERAGYEVVAVVASAGQAVRAAAKTTPDLVLMDVVLTGKTNGVEAALRICRRRQVPIVYLTANRNRKILEEAKATAPIAFIFKPYQKRDLLATIEISLHRFRAEREQANEALHESEARYRELFQTTQNAIALVDLKCHLISCNPAFLKVFGCANAADLPAGALEQLIQLRSINRTLRTQTNPGGNGLPSDRETRCRRKNGSSVNVIVRSWLRKDRSGEPVGIWITLMDITERKKAEQRIIEYQQQLQSLLLDLSVAEERERQRIATDIHDRISQTLGACQMRVEAMAHAGTLPKKNGELQEIARLLERTIRDTSSLIFELCPPVLHQLGLASALDWYGEKLQESHGLSVDVRQTQPVPSLTGDQRTALFRAACELMNNAAKHAQTTHLQVSLGCEEGCFHVVIEDGGIGFQATSAAWNKAAGGFGLFHVRERMRAWGGDFEIDSVMGRGTRALLCLPLTDWKQKNETLSH